MPSKKPEKKEDVCCHHDKSPFIAIPASLAGIFLALSVLVMAMAKDQAGILVPIVWAFVVLGIVALIVAYKAMKH